MKLSQKQKAISESFLTLFESILNFKHSSRKDNSHS